MRWGALGPVAAASIVPALLVVAGLVDSADLMLALAAETTLLTAFAGLQAAFSSTSGVGSPLRLAPGSHWQDELDGGLARVLLGGALVCTGAAAYAAAQVTWDATSAIGIVLVLAYALTGVWRRSWQAGDLLPTGVRGLFWRLALVAVGFLVLLPMAAAVGDLRAAGWSPVGPAERVLLSGVLAPAAWPALLLVVFRALNEVGFAAWRLAGEPGPDVGPELAA